MAIELIRRGQSQIYGQVGVGLRGQTWINLADAGDTSPQTVENLGAAKTYLLINSEGANVEIDTVDTPTPVKLTGETSFDFVWSSGKIALYELSAEEAALDVAVLGQKYHYVSGTKSTNSVRVKSVGGNLDSQNTLKVSSYDVRVYGDKCIVDPSKPIYIKQNIPATHRVCLRFWDSAGIEITSGLAFNSYAGLGFYYNAYWGWTNGTDVTSSQNTLITIAANKGICYVQTGARISGTVTERLVSQTVTAYEPYKESSITTPEIGRSLPNGVKDEVNVTTGVKTQNVSEDTLVSDTVYASLDTSTYTNVDVIKTTAFSLAKAGTTGADGQTHYYNKDGVELMEVAQADIDLEASVVKYYWGEDKKLYIIVAKGDYADIAAARTGLDVTSLNYQLAEPIASYIDPQPLQIFPNGSRWVEHANKEVAIYNTGIHVTNTDLPIKEMIKVDKIGLQNGRWYREPVDLADVTVAPDGLSFTIDGATSGPYEQYEFEYYYDSALSTLPELVIPDEPSLVTIKNRNISL